MLKKILIKQNTELFDKLQNLQAENCELKDQIKKQNEIQNNLKQEIDRLNTKLNATEPLKQLEAKVVKQSTLPLEVEYGASVIGKLVIDAAKYCNILSTDLNMENTKELINLILGRTEVAKSEILKIVSDVSDNELKHKRIDEQYDTAVDYFNSVLAQR